VRALVIRLSSIGDVVHTLPTAAALRGAGWEAGWVVEPPARPLLEDNPAVAQVVVAPPARRFGLGEALRGLRTLRARRYDVALDLQGLWKSAGWARLSGARRVVGFARAWRREPLSSLLLGEAAPLASGASHVIDKNLALLRPLGLEVIGGRDFPLPDAPESRSRIARRLSELGARDFVVLNPGGGWASKLWPAERLAGLARRLRALGLLPLVSFGPGEEPLAEQVVAASGGAAVRSFPTSLLELVELVRRARIVVASDTGPLHLACAVGTPVVALFGPTDPARNGPFDPEDEVVRRAPPCAPCYRRGCSVHAGIMDTIGLEEVAAAAERRLARAGWRAHAVQA
jgi:ADP-heptose:LPS heptosyltransferase